jgi:hypothetical protein
MIPFENTPGIWGEGVKEKDRNISCVIYLIYGGEQQHSTNVAEKAGYLPAEN